MVIVGLCLTVCALPGPPNGWCLETPRSSVPFGMPNQSPLSLALLPFSPASAHVRAENCISLRSTMGYSSIFSMDQSQTTALNLDMELFSIALRGDYVIGDTFQVGAEVPFVYFSGGFLDSFIQDYHDFFGFPTGGRERVENDLVRYQLYHKGKKIIDRQGTTKGIGDFKVYGKYSVFAESANSPALSLLGQVSLPTGSEGKGIGAGGPTFAVGLAADKRLGKFLLNANALFFYLKETGLTSPLDVENVVAGSFSIGYCFSPSITFIRAAQRSDSAF